MPLLCNSGKLCGIKFSAHAQTEMFLQVVDVVFVVVSRRTHDAHGTFTHVLCVGVAGGERDRDKEAGQGLKIPATNRAFHEGRSQSTGV